MTKETARTISQVCLIGGILIILATCGVCCTGKGTYGPEEFYDKGDGTVGYGAKFYGDNTETLALLLGVGIPLAFLLIIVSARLSGHAEKLPDTLPPIRRKVKEKAPDIPKELMGFRDPLFVVALRGCVESKRKASSTSLQRHLGIGSKRAEAILEAMVHEGFIGEIDGASNSRPILLKAYEYINLTANSDEALKHENTD